MSEEELVGAYTQGRISRRVFVRKLVAGGLSLSAAVAYSNLLGAEPAAAAVVAAAKHHKHHGHKKHKKHKKHDGDDDDDDRDDRDDDDRRDRD